MYETQNPHGFTDMLRPPSANLLAKEHRQSFPALVNFLSNYFVLFLLQISLFYPRDLFVKPLTQRQRRDSPSMLATADRSPLSVRCSTMHVFQIVKSSKPPLPCFVFSCGQEIWDELEKKYKESQEKEIAAPNAQSLNDQVVADHEYTSITNEEVYLSPSS
ncbi:uncharacterized protein LOC131162787 [Malania oleifera]|uniref:uncharacterized protein LOC131162787 n=1 Tax=Malania oleifera TaxID=397392 RepID=UPI0025AE7CFE|nr:uncharacterized protein LOC131162787 [Malania oleifera]